MARFYLDPNADMGNGLDFSKQYKWLDTEETPSGMLRADTGTDWSDFDKFASGAIQVLAAAGMGYGAYAGLAGAGAAGAAGSTSGGVAAGDAALAGGGEVGSGYAASAPGAAGTTAGATGAVGDAGLTGGTGTNSMTGEAVGDWWTEMGLTAGDVGMESTPFTTDPSYADLGGPSYGGSSGFDAAAYAKQYGPAALQGLLRAFPGLLGAYASNKQAGALQNLSGQYANYGAPSRARYEASMTPGFDPMSIPGYSGAVDSASKSLLARLSATGGNPYGNPGGLIDANKQIIAGTALPAIQGYQNLNAGTGFGSTLGASGQMAGQAIGAQGNIYNAIGAGINDVINPPQTLAQQLADLQKSGLYSKNSL